MKAISLREFGPGKLIPNLTSNVEAPTSTVDVSVKATFKVPVSHATNIVPTLLAKTPLDFTE